MRHLKPDNTIASILILMGATLMLHSPSYAQEKFDFTQCLHPKAGGAENVVPKQFTIADSEFGSKNGLLGPSVAGDPLNINTEIFNSVELKEGKSSDESLRGGAINLTTGTVESRVAISGQRAFSQGKGKATFFTLEFSAPAAKTGDTELTQLGEFASDAKAKFSLFQTFGGWEFRLTDEKKDIIRKEIFEGIKAVCDQNCSEKFKKDGVEGTILSSDCVNKYASEENKELYRNEIVRTSSLFLGGSASIGYKKFEFKDIAADRDVSQTKIPWSLEMFAGRYSADRKTLFRAGYTYIGDYKAADKINLCQAPEDDAMGAQICENLTTSGPEGNQKDVGFVEVRHKIDKSIIQAATVKLSYDFDEKEMEVDMPIYLLSDEKKNLNGGIRLGWSESDDIKLGVFIGSAFSLSAG